MEHESWKNIAEKIGETFGKMSEKETNFIKQLEAKIMKKLWTADPKYFAKQMKRTAKYSVLEISYYTKPFEREKSIDENDTDALQNKRFKKMCNTINKYKSIIIKDFNSKLGPICGGFGISNSGYMETENAGVVQKNITTIFLKA